MNRKVSYMRLHANLYVPGIGEMGSVLPNPSKTFKDFSVTKIDDGFIILANNIEIWVASANVVLAVLAPEACPQPKVADESPAA